MKHFGTSVLLFLFFLCTLSCDNNDDGPNACVDLAVTALAVTYVDTVGHTADVNVSFDVPSDESCVDHYQLLFVKTEEAMVFDLQTATALDEANGIRINKTGAAIAQRLPIDAVDVDGELIEAGRNYRLFVLSAGSVETANALSESIAFILGNDARMEIVAEIPIGTGGIVVDEAGNIYSADFGLASSGNSGTVRRISPDGEISVFATGFTEPSGNVIGPDGHIYQSDFSTGKISQIAADGSVTTIASGMNGPVGLIFDPDGNLFVANCLGNAIRKVSPDGEVTTFSSSSLFNCPNGITIDDAGNIYVANFMNANLIKVTSDGNAALFASFPGSNLGHLLFYENEIYITARGIHEIHKVSLDGDATKIAGTGNRGHETSSPLQSEFSLPNDLGFSPDGKYLYINDAVQVTGVPVAPSYLKRIKLN
ncbi:MAG: SMP-30/gluconolactonase/LRE family protein [Bacteroidota bacterium]